MLGVNGNRVRTEQPAGDPSSAGPAPVGPASLYDENPQQKAPGPVLVELSDLSKAYSEAGRKRLVLDHLDREFRSGEFVCLLGKSGSGKSTLLNLISGIDNPSSGKVLFHNGNSVTDLTGLSEQKRTLFRREHIGIVFQFFNLIPTLTVLENVTLPMELAGAEPFMREKALDLLARVGLEGRQSTYPDKLSGGEQQRVAIARALINDPLLILADEPTGNLDDETGETVLNLLLELTRGAGKTLLMATHATEAANRADRVLHLVHGKLVRDQVWRASRPEFAGQD